MTLPRRAEAALARLATFGIRPGLENTERLLAALGNPQKRQSTVLVAGTNGKGTTSALLASAVSAAGYRTGLFTSPHLESVEERIRIDGEAVSGEELGDALMRVVAVADELLVEPTTYFEALTAAALTIFVDQDVELAVLEVGLGGRLDATNVCSPILSVVTSISLDHRRHLGESVTEIAAEKAGILRSGRPVVVGAAGDAQEVVRQAAQRLGAAFVSISERLESFESEPLGRSGQAVRMKTGRRAYDLRSQLAGRHQAENLALAVLAAEELADLGFPRLDADAICRGVAGCHWPGRLERIELKDDRVVLLDGAHNPQAAAALRSALDEARGGWTLVFGVLADKEVEGMLPLLAESVDRVVLTCPAGSQGRKPESYRELWRESTHVEVINDPEMALERCLGSSGARIVVAGSLHLVGDLRAFLRRRFGRPAPATASIFRSPPQEASS